MSRKIYISALQIFVIVILCIALIYWLLLLLHLNKVVLYISPCSDVAIFPISAVFAGACRLTLTRGKRLFSYQYQKVRRLFETWHLLKEIRCSTDLMLLICSEIFEKFPEKSFVESIFAWYKSEDEFWKKFLPELSVRRDHSYSTKN